MHIARSPLALAAVIAGLAAVPAHADKVTMGSDLKADATMIEAHGQDTAIWPVKVKGESQEMPADGQVLSVTVKGSVNSEPGAAQPANLIHFQTLDPEGRNGAKRVYLTSQAFYMPIDQPNAVTTFTPENLCIKKDGVVAFNDIGGFMYGGSLDAPLDPDHYQNGAPFQIAAAVRSSTTARFSSHDKTKNGDVLDPSVGNDPSKPNGSVNRGQELLMQYVIGFGDDRSESCGGPRRHPDGSLVEPKVHELRVAGKGKQRPYVTKDRRFNIGVYCESPDDGCVGTGNLQIDGKSRQKVSFNVPAQSSSRVGFRLSKKYFKKLDKAGTLNVTLVLTSQFGTLTTPLELHR